MNKDIIKRAFFVMQFLLLLGLMFWFPWVQERLSIFQMKELYGAYTLEEKPVITADKWLNGSFQKSWQLYMQEDKRVRPLFVRIKNQLQYDIFDKSPNSTIILGKDNYLFGRQELDAWMGLDFIGDSAIRRKTHMLVTIQEYLNAKGKKLLLVLPPSKPGFIPQKLPEHLQQDFNKLNNRSAFITAFQANGLPYLAFEDFSSEQFDEPYLYPASGLHWSHMGASLAMDTLIHQIERQLSIQMKNLQIDSVSFSQNLRPPDNDLGSVLNLIRPEETYPMPYPTVRFISDSSTITPRLLIIGDSFYRTFFDLGYHQAVFSPLSTYWHYFTQEISAENPIGAPLIKDRLKLTQTIADNDLVLIMAGESNLHQLGFGFIEALFENINQPDTP